MTKADRDDVKAGLKRETFPRLLDLRDVHRGLATMKSYSKRERADFAEIVKLITAEMSRRRRKR